MRRKNELQVTVGKGWYASPMPGWMESPDKLRRKNRERALFAELHLSCQDGSREVISTDPSWQWAESPVRFSEIYDGEICDGTFSPEEWQQAETMEGPTELLIPQEGEEIRETERIRAKEVFTTPAGETVVDFGQESDRLCGGQSDCRERRADQVPSRRGAGCRGKLLQCQLPQCKGGGRVYLPQRKTDLASVPYLFRIPVYQTSGLSQRARKRKLLRGFRVFGYQTDRADPDRQAGDQSADLQHFLGTEG